MEPDDEIELPSLMDALASSRRNAIKARYYQELYSGGLSRMTPIVSPQIQSMPRHGRPAVNLQTIDYQEAEERMARMFTYDIESGEEAELVQDKNGIFKRMMKMNPGSIKPKSGIQKPVTGTKGPEPIDPKDQALADVVMNAYNSDCGHGYVNEKTRYIRRLYESNPALLDNAALSKAYVNAIGQEHFDGAIAPVKKRYAEYVRKLVQTVAPEQIEKDPKYSYIPVKTREWIIAQPDYSERVKSHYIQKREKYQFYNNMRGHTILVRITPRAYIAEAVPMLAAMRGMEFIVTVNETGPGYTDGGEKDDPQVTLTPLYDDLDKAQAELRKKIKHRKDIKGLWHSDVTFIRRVTDDELRKRHVLANAKRKIDLDD